MRHAKQQVTQTGEPSRPTRTAQQGENEAMAAKAKVMCESLCILCHNCGEPIAHPETGSEFWTVWELPRKQFSLKCPCGSANNVDVPKSAKLMCGELT